MRKKTAKTRPGLKICVVTGIPPLNLLVYKFIQVLEPTVDELVLITGNYPEKDVFSPKIKLINIVPDTKKQSLLFRIPKFIFLQLKFAWHLVSNLSQTKTVFFFLEGGLFLFPMLVAKLARKKTIIVATHSSTLIAKQLYKSKNMPRIISIVENLNYKLVDKIIIFYPSMLEHFKLEKYTDKIIVAHRHFINFDVFKIEYPLDKRPNIIGFVGRLSKEKGILNFLASIKLLSEKEKSLSFFIVGDGELRDEVQNYIDKENLGQRVRIIGWVQHEELLPKYFNKMKLMVLPSYTEGLANVILEAMACGTPVLATAVGAIPDVIKDGQNGFLLKNNSSKAIADGIVRALKHPDLEHIAINALVMMKRNYILEETVKRYGIILKAISLNEELKEKDFN